MSSSIESENLTNESENLTDESENLTDESENLTDESENLTDPVEVGYIRESTEEQASGTHALEQQEARLENFGVQKSLIFSDVDSGAKIDRDALNQIMVLARERKIKRIVATRWDRLTRSYELYLQFKKILQEFNVELWFKKLVN
jgi:predicted site-specific integrase-resolvase